MDFPVVTVLMPVFSCEKYIRESINSILNQTYRNFEFIIIDDASTDLTVNFIMDFKDERIKIIQNELNSGPSVSLNRGMLESKGKFLAIMHGDDIADSRRINSQVKYMISNPDVAVLGCQYLTINQSNKKIISKSRLPLHHDSIVASLLFANPICHPTVMLRKESLANLGLQYEHEFRLCEDYDLWTRLALRGLKFHNLDIIGLSYRRHSQQASSAKSSKEQEQFEIIKHKYREKCDSKLDEMASLLDNFNLLDLDKIVFLISKLTESNKFKAVLYKKLRIAIHQSIKLNQQIYKFDIFDYLNFLYKSKCNGWDLAIIYQLLKRN